jgi:hypothetical protein
MVQADVRRRQVLAVLIEHLHALVGAVGGTRGRGRFDPYRVELTVLGAPASPGHECFPFRSSFTMREFVRPSATSAAVRRNASGPAEVRLVARGHALFAERHQQPFPVVGKDVNNAFVSPTTHTRSGS